jgi:hypothetical protein
MRRRNRDNLLKFAVRAKLSGEKADAFATVQVFYA